MPAAALSLRGLTKRYGPSTLALDRVSLDLAEGGITALLGHNGAGKSTLVGLVTGMLTPTEGDCLVGGASMVREPHRARRSLGVCPQVDVLWPELSVEEHLRVYAAVKGLPGGAWAHQVSRSPSCTTKRGSHGWLHMEQ